MALFGRLVLVEGSETLSKKLGSEDFGPWLELKKFEDPATCLHIVAQALTRVLLVLNIGLSFLK